MCRIMKDREKVTKQTGKRKSSQSGRVMQTQYVHHGRAEDNKEMQLDIWQKPNQELSTWHDQTSQ